MKDPVSVSVIIPVYNGAKVIERSIKSLKEQDYPSDKLQIIVADNNSSDNTEEIVRSCGVDYIKEDAIQSSYAARNKGASIANGDALVFFDADQVADKHWIKNLVAGWENEEIGAFKGLNLASRQTDNVASHYWSSDETTPDPPKDGHAMNFDKIAGGNVAFRKEVFKKLEGFDPSFFSLGDFDLAYRLQKELNLNIKYNKDAVIYQQDRSTWQSLLKREFRMGFGRYQFGCKHKELRLNILFEFWLAFKRTLIGLLAMLVRLFRLEQWNEKKLSLGLTWLDINMKWSSFGGKCQGIFTGGKRAFPASW